MRAGATGRPCAFTTLGLVSSAGSWITAAQVEISTAASFRGASEARISLGSRVGEPGCQSGNIAGRVVQGGERSADLAGMDGGQIALPVDDDFDPPLRIER